jgi:HTH-type transcriptional regulator / antitoxin HigA
MNAAAAVEYGEILNETKPKVIQGEAENRVFIETLERLTAKDNVSAAEGQLIELLLVLVKEYEARSGSLPDAGPLDIIRHLMDEHELRQKDLVDVFGTESIVSDVLNGKRELQKEHIKRLSTRFHVSPAVFF